MTKWGLAGMLDYSFSPAYGVWWIRVYRLMAMIKAPWSLMLFSERYGHRKFWPRKGWRIRFSWQEAGHE